MTADEQVRTAVVIVHGMGEQRPMETLDGFVKTALYPHVVKGEPTWDYYYSRPAEITGSYEARRYIAPRRADITTPDGEVQGQAEIYEYHWSYLMTGNRFADVMPKTLRLLLRRPSNVHDPLFGIWRVVWIVILALLLAIPALFVGGYLLNSDVPGWIIGLIASAVILLFWFGLIRMVGRALVNKVTASFVDVVRYLDTSPHSYAARRAIRGGLVDLLYRLHDGRYSRIVVVAHSLGAYITYDALTSLWAQVHQLHAATDAEATKTIPLESLDDLEGAADRLIAEPDAGGRLDDFQQQQFALWQDLRSGLEKARPRAPARHARCDGPSRRPGPLPAAQRDAARRERRPAWRELPIEQQRAARGARFAVGVRGHPLDQPMVSGETRWSAR